MGRTRYPGITPAWAGKSRRTVFAVFRPEDHPRMGGEKARWYPIKYGGQGSPPHGRGKVPAVLQCRRFRGITPAWAGKSSGQHNASLVNKDHPRVGGEKDNAEFREKIDQGSPQRGRGKDVLILDGAGVVGITPAWAGKSGVPCCSIRPWWDHPRVGGEKARTLIVQNEPQGSPPRRRGKARHLSHGLLPCG